MYVYNTWKYKKSEVEIETKFNEIYDNPFFIQLEPLGDRGYIELVAVKEK